MSLWNILLTVLVLAVPRAQTAQTVEDGTIHVNTRLVQVNVVVRDKTGPVSGLSKADFTLFDNGKPQRIDVFSASTTRTPAKPAILPGSGVVSNLLNSAGEAPGETTVILFDLINITNDAQENLVSSRVLSPRTRVIRDGRSAPPGVGNANFGSANVSMEDRQYAMKQLLDYIRTIREGDQVALYVLGNELSVVQDFTGDTRKLVRAAEKLKQMDAAGVEVRTLSQLADLLEPPPVSTPGGPVYVLGPDFANSMLTAAAITRANATSDALQSIARHLSGLPGRKNLVWLTAGFPFIPEQLSETPNGGAQSVLHETPDNFSAQLGRASKALTDANVALYPVDIQGLRGGYPEVMLRLADATGGRVAQHTNNLAGAVRTAVADGEVSYTLGFYPLSEHFDGRTHDLKVKVDRKGLEVRHRSSYDAVAEPVLTPAQRQARLSELLSSPLNASEIGLVAVAETDKANPGTFKVAISIDISHIRLTNQKGRYAGTLSVAAHLESFKSNTAEVVGIPVSLTEAQYLEVRQRGMMIQRTFQSHPGDSIRIVVQDQASGLAGSLSVPLGTPERN